jgi:hypothetical protein
LPPINFTYDMYLLGLTQQVPLDKLLTRLSKLLPARWGGDTLTEDRIVRDYLLLTASI